ILQGNSSQVGKDFRFTLHFILRPIYSIYSPHTYTTQLKGYFFLSFVLVAIPMTNQERTRSILLEQALKIRDDVMTATQGSVRMESSARKLLENHIRIITHIVKQLSKDIQVLEAQIIERDNLAAGTTFAVKSLDHKNMTGIGDLRGRVARCDASIAKLSSDVSAGCRDILKLQQEVNELHSGLELKLKDMELKVEMESMIKENMAFLSGHMERLEAELEKVRSSDRTKRTENKLNSKINTLEQSFREELEQMRSEYQSGFQAVHDAIASLRHIGDTKAKLDKGELQRDIRQIQRNMVGLKEP
uniref:Family with sequence similarity 81 member B n=1 Tax=Cyprinus carpio TaxID=7962 RepID=A0A8C2JA57_CYPCA